MSRIAPIGLRIGSGTCHSSFIGNSSYFFEKQNKQNLTLKKALLPLSKTLKWLIGPNKRGSLMVLQPGLMPMHSILRARKHLHLAYGQSHAWYNDKIFAFLSAKAQCHMSDTKNLNADLAHAVLNVFKKLCIYKRQGSKRVLTKKNILAQNQIMLGREVGNNLSGHLDKVLLKKHLTALQLSQQNNQDLLAGLQNVPILINKQLKKCHNVVGKKFAYNIGPLMILKAKIQDHAVVNSAQPQKLIYRKARTYAALVAHGLNLFFCKKPVPGAMPQIIWPALGMPYTGRLTKASEPKYGLQNLEQLPPDQDLSFGGLKQYPKSSVLTAQGERNRRNPSPNLWHRELSSDHVRTYVVSQVGPKMAISRSINGRCQLNMFNFLIGALAPGWKQLGHNNKGIKAGLKKGLARTNTPFSLALWKQPGSFAGPTRIKLGLSRLKTCAVLALGLHMKNNQTLVPALSLRL